MSVTMEKIKSLMLPGMISTMSGPAVLMKGLLTYG